jgi:hypothetical protein
MTLRSSSTTFLRGALVAAAAIGAIIAGFEAPAIADTLARKLSGSDAGLVACAETTTTLHLRRIRPPAAQDKVSYDKTCVNRQVAMWGAMD